MTLLGLSAGQLAALFGGAFVITVALYLLKQRRRTVEVAYLPLWEHVLADRQTTALLSRLRHLLSLLLALLIVGLLVLSLGDPRFGRADDDRRLLILVDTSPSMGASDVSPSRLSEAQRKAQRIVEASAPGTPILVASLSDTVLPMGPFSPERAAAKSAIERLSLRPREADLGAALAFASDVLTGHAGRLVLIGDGRMRAPDENAATSGALPDIEYLPIGRADSANLIVSALSVRRYPLDRDHSETLVQVENAGREAAEATLELREGERLLMRETLTLAPGTPTQRVYADLAGIDQAIEARLIAHEPSRDQLALDSRAVATVPPRRRAHVLCVTRGSLYLQAALLLDEYLTVDLIAPSDYDAASARDYDALVFDDFVPAEPAPTPALYLHPAGTGPGAPLSITGEMQAPFVERLERDHPLLRWTAVSDVNIARALRVQPADGDTVVARAADGPLIVAGARDGVPFVALTFRPSESDLPLRAAFPLLLLNAIDGFQQQGHNYLAALEAGATAALPVPGPDRVLTLTGPHGPVAGDVRDGVLYFVADAPGLYRSEGGELPPLAAQLSDTLDPHIAPADQLDAKGSAIPATRALPEPRPERTPWAILVALAAALLLFEWLSFHRRWTV